MDRLTFSVEWILNESGEIESEWFGRSVISSCVKLAYEHAQQMIDKPGLNRKNLYFVRSTYVVRKFVHVSIVKSHLSLLVVKVLTSCL